MFMRKPKGYDMWFGKIDRLRKQQERESKAYRRQVEKERKEKERIRERERKVVEREREKSWKASLRSKNDINAKRYNHSNASSFSSNNTNINSPYSPSPEKPSVDYTTSKENGCVTAFVSFCFIVVGLLAIILPFVWRFWTPIKIMFVIAGILSILTPIIGQSKNKK